ncbi:flagellar hook-basal body protein [Alkaliphilus peptidifermentans]|uniref:Flagellar basal-body rod protein FlgG n=1 Tax=Alkaliphilus peptidifermentans DSM 18978 TaxID=1120976 RepID=A0A1G5JGA0_9FIRM|nr:flagellar hook-basal body protein [Alkaliphilus peptidifermentans]SCY87184.1 flagellar basal-body rod protein FlgG [Alkaliphilus peptidifermentans DSM 18978]
MLRGLYTAVSAMQTTEKKLDVSANNMANVNTTSYKKDVVISESFPEVLLQKINGKIPPEAFKAAPIEIDQQGNGFKLKAENGLFTVKTQLGNSYNSEIRLAADESGYLKTYNLDNNGNIDTTDGSMVLDSNGNSIFVGEEPFEISANGQVTVNGQATANLITRGHYNTIGTINGGLRLNHIEVDFSQGTLQETGNDLDIALKGSGFFKVLTPNGEMYTRNGNFSLNDNGEVITGEGYFLAGQWGSILVDGQDFQLTDRGEVIINNEIVDQIEIVDIENVKGLRKHGHGYFYVEEGVELQANNFSGNVIQGFLEASNVNPIKEMIDMINIYRTYESNQKVVRTYDELLQKAANEIGKIG